MKWPTEKLGDVIDLVGGGTPAKSNENFYNGDIPWATVRDMNHPRLHETEWRITEEAVTKSSTNVIPSGNVIIATRVGLGKACILAQDTAINQDLKALIPKESNIDKRYLFWWVSSIAKKIQGAGTGATVKGVRLDFVKSLNFPIPSLTEQKRIVAILDEAFADIDKARALTERNLENARELFESSLQEVFSCKSEGWELRPLDSLSSIINGYAFKSGEFSSSNELRAIKITNVGVYNFVEDSESYLPSEFAEKYHRYKAYAGDVIVALTRTIISGGLKVAVVPNSYNGALVNQRVAAVRVNENVMPKELLQAFMSTKSAIKYVKSNVNELMQPNLSIKDLKQFPIPVPPKEEVRTVLSQVNAIRDAKQFLTSIYTSKLELLEELKKSLLQKAFTGELTKAA